MAAALLKASQDKMKELVDCLKYWAMNFSPSVVSVSDIEQICFLLCYNRIIGLVPLFFCLCLQAGVPVIYPFQYKSRVFSFFLKKKNVC